MVETRTALGRASTEVSDPGEEPALPEPMPRGSYPRIATALGQVAPTPRRARLHRAVSTSDGVPDPIYGDDDEITELTCL